MDKDRYIKTLMMIIKRGLSLANRNELARPVLESRAEDWFDVLKDKIPLEYLAACEEKALAIKQDTNPTHFSELTYAYELLKKEGKIEGAGSRKHCSFRSWHLEGYDTPHIQSRENRPNAPKMIIPCSICNATKGEDYTYFDELDEEIKDAFKEKDRVLTRMTPLDKARQKKKENERAFFETDFSDRAAQNALSEEWYELREQELKLQSE